MVARWPHLGRQVRMHTAGSSVLNTTDIHQCSNTSLSGGSCLQHASGCWSCCWLLVMPSCCGDDLHRHNSCWQAPTNTTLDSASH